MGNYFNQEFSKSKRIAVGYQQAMYRAHLGLKTYESKSLGRIVEKAYAVRGNDDLLCMNIASKSYESKNSLGAIVEKAYANQGNDDRLRMNFAGVVATHWRLRTCTLLDICRSVLLDSSSSVARSELVDSLISAERYRYAAPLFVFELRRLKENMEEKDDIGAFCAMVSASFQAKTRYNTLFYN